MRQEIFCIHDHKAAAYLPPFFLHNIPMAQRVFTDCVNSKDHQFGAHPADYTLFHLGSYDDETALIKQNKSPTPIGNGVEFLKPSDQTDQFFGDDDEAKKRNGASIQPDT